MATLQRAAARFPTHAELGADHAVRANQLRQLPGGRWLDLDDPDHPDDHGSTTRPGRRDIVSDLAARLVAYLGKHAPPSQLATSRGAEAVLARACVVLTGWESAYRGGQLPDHAAARHADPEITVDALLAAVPDHQVAELVDLAARAHRCGLLARLAPAPPTPPGIAGPVFVQHWADGDLLLPTTGADPTVPGHVDMTLLDVKTVISVRDPDRVGRWLWQLLGYAWLDAADRYRIRDVGLYLARHGTLTTWPTADLAAALLAGPDGAPGRDVDEAAAEFRRLAEHVIADETGQPGAWLARPPPR